MKEVRYHISGMGYDEEQTYPSHDLSTTGRNTCGGRFEAERQWMAMYLKKYPTAIGYVLISHEVGGDEPGFLGTGYGNFSRADKEATV